jgi:hypothetical protein
MNLTKIEKILKTIPKEVIVLGVVKGRSKEQIVQLISSKINFIGENYINQTENHQKLLQKNSNFKNLKWHFIGHLQTNKVKKALDLFDMIETVDSLKLAQKLDREAAKKQKQIDILLEINIAKEAQKTGFQPEEIIEKAKLIIQLENLNLKGLMTMGPFVKNPEEIRPYFKQTKKLFDQLKQLNLNNTEIKYLSMGMSQTYQIAIEEGANIVRIGRIFFE